LSKQVKDFEGDATMIATGNNSFSIDFNSHWQVSGALNGGFLMSVALKAAMNCIPLNPLSFTGYYMNKGLANTNAKIDVQILSKTKSTAVAEVSVTQQGLLRTKYLGVFGDIENMKGISHSTLKAPELPPISQCVDGGAMLRKLVNNDENWTIVNGVEFRASATSPYVISFLSDKRGNEAVSECWVGFADGYAPCVRSLAYFSDGIPPCVLNLTPFTWVPTLEYGAHFWSTPKPSTESEATGYFDGKHWLRARFRSDHVINGTLYTDGELWSADGKELLATSRQIARVLAPR